MKRNHKKNSDYSMAHVLYQKLGSDWYAFTEVDGDCFMTKVDPNDVEKIKMEESIDQPKRAPSKAA